MSIIEDIISFWFEGITDAAPVDKGKNPYRKWFAKDARFDQEIRDRFGPVYRTALGGDYRNWEDSARGRLALVVLFDQFSRNMFRNTPEMFGSDRQALEIALRSRGDGADKELKLIERVFLYMPFQHAEDENVQKISLEAFADLAAEAKVACPRNAHYFDYTLVYARRHADIIAKFGRFPHRNAILGRAATKEENDFLAKPGSSF